MGPNRRIGRCNGLARHPASGVRGRSGAAQGAAVVRLSDCAARPCLGSGASANRLGGASGGDSCAKVNGTEAGPVPSGLRPIYWKIALGLSRLSEPSKSIFDRPSAMTARSMEAVWVTRASTAARISVSPLASPAASI